MSRELLQVRVNEASNCSKMKISSFQSVVCKNCSKLEINYLHNMKASMRYYVLTNMFLNRLFKFRMIASQLWSKFCNFFPSEALLELAAVTDQHSFHPHNTFSKKNHGC